MSYGPIAVMEIAGDFVFVASFKDGSGGVISASGGLLRLQKQLVSGALSSYDFSSNTFKTTALTTETLAMTHQKTNNGTVDTGLFTAVVGTTTGFAVGDNVIVRAYHPDASPTFQEVVWQYGDGMLDEADGVEVGTTVRQALKLVLAASAGKLSGAGTTTETIRNAVADSKNRIIATVDASGNRTAIVYDVT